MNRKIFAVIGLVSVALVIYFIAGNDDSMTKENETENIKELVHEYSTGTIKNQTASITSHQLIVTDSDKKETIYTLPENDFFVSIAPYVDHTHTWAIHNLTGCQGELVNEEFSVLIENTEGNMILDETLISQANGFIDLWLPRDQTYHVTIEHDGKRVESEITTYEGDNTCITTMQLM